MIVPVVVLLNGVLVPAVPPAELVVGRVMVPLAPVVTRFAERVAVDGFGAIVIEAHGHRCTFRIGVAEAACDDRVRALELAPYERDGTAFVPLGDVARALGGTIDFDPASATVGMWLAPERALVTPPPSGAPPGGPTPALTPVPTPTPVPVASGSPHPRRTAIPVNPG